MFGQIVKNVSEDFLAVTFCPPPGDLGLCPLKSCVEADVGDDEDWGPLYLLLSHLSWQRFLPPPPGPHDDVFTVSWSAGSEVSPTRQRVHSNSAEKSKTSDDGQHSDNNQL